jgi:uncharacterized linocin/CFP29 family protein
MTYATSQVPWTDEQWARVNQVIQDEAHRARVAARFLPLFGPLAAYTDFVRNETISYKDIAGGGGKQKITIADTDTIKLPTLQVKVYLRGAQMADPELRSVLAVFRRAANVLARLEDAVIFTGQTLPDPDNYQAQPNGGIGGLQDVWEILGGQQNRGLVGPDTLPIVIDGRHDAQNLVAAISKAIGILEGRGHFGPFAVVLNQRFFLIAQTPDPGSLVLPQDRIIPFLAGGPLLRSSTLDDSGGVVIALGGDPVELVVATDMTVQFLQVAPDPIFIFRLMERMALRVKESDAIINIIPEPTVTGVNPNTGARPGDRIEITGANFVRPISVQFGIASASPVDINKTRDKLTVPLPAGPAGGGPVPVKVVTPGGDFTLPNAYTY